MRKRIIPTLLLKSGEIYKTRKFKKPSYVGEPINIVRIFNEKEVDEIIILDIDASLKKMSPNIELLRKIASECFMPLSYGGGIDSVEIGREILAVGIEKLVINSNAWTNKELIPNLVSKFGRSTIIGSIDYKRTWRGYSKTRIKSGTKSINKSPIVCAKILEELGVGEIMINSIDRDGELVGYDHETIKKITSFSNIPIIASGGANSLEEINKVIDISGASAAAAGAFFIYQGKHRAVLISYPSNYLRGEIKE